MVSRHHGVEHSLRTRDAILDAAEHLLSEEGYQGMTIEEVARQANLGKGTIYLYFDSKQELALSIVDRFNVRLRDRLRQILKTRLDPEERLRLMLLERVMYRFDIFSTYKRSLDEVLGCLRPLLLERRKSYVDQEAVLFVEAIVEGRTLGRFYCDDPLETAQALLTATAALLPYSLSPAELGSRRALERRAEFLTRLLIRALNCEGCDQNLGLVTKRK